MSANTDFSSYDEMDEDELFDALGESLLGDGSGMGTRDRGRNHRFGKQWFQEHLPEFRTALCKKGAVKRAIHSTVPVEASTVFDALATSVGHPAYTIAAVLIARRGLQWLCTGIS